MFRAALDAISGFFEWLGLRERRAERADAEADGAAQQRLETSEEAVRARDEQLKKQVNRRPGDGRRALDDGSF